MRQTSKGYFKEWSDMRFSKGKTFISNTRLFKRDKALYFPNLYGSTLVEPSKPKDTTPVLRGRISLVSVFSSLWAQKQTESFTGKKQNPGLHEILAQSKGITQRIDINAEGNRLKALLVRLFMWNMQRRLDKDFHSRYFLVTKGFTDALKSRIGMMNTKVGYVYLLDEHCRIRWAGSSVAREDERESLVKGIQKLIVDGGRGEELKYGVSTKGPKPASLSSTSETSIN